MGNSSSKVELMSEPPKHRGYFSFMKVKSNKSKDFGKDFCTYKKQPQKRSECSSERSNSSETTNRHTNKREEKFRTRFDPRITARYDIKALIGRGSFSHVVRVEHRYTHQPFAIKLLEVGEHKGRDTCHVELGILRRVHHANIIRLVEVFETPHRVYLVLELATGGELLDRIVSRGSFTERDATKALIMVSRGLSYIHALGVIHRDLKPENLLYYHPGQDSRLIITDFGLACWSQKSQMVECDVVTGGSYVAGTGEHIASCAQSDREDDRIADDADSCDIVERKAKGAEDNCRLIDGGKARDESSQRTVVAIRGDRRKDTNGISTEDEREIDKSLGFEGLERGSNGVVDEMSSAPKFSGGTKRTQNACIEESKTESYEHTNVNMAEQKDEKVTQNTQMQFSHDKLHKRRQNDCVKSRRDRVARSHDKPTTLQCKVKEYSDISSEGQKSNDWALRTLCGTPEYLAPEMVAGRTYGHEVDMWALGVISYIVLSGSLPFEQRSRPRLFTTILRGSYNFHGQPWSSISNQAKDFIERLLCVNPEQRMTAEQALKHPWLHNMAACSSNTNLHRPISRNLLQQASRASNYSSSSRPDSRQLFSTRSHHTVALSA